jgi:nucleoid DNA-binding protein
MGIRLMDREDIVKAVAAGCGLDLARADKAVDAVLDWIMAELQTAGQARIPGLGTFRLHPANRPSQEHPTVVFTPCKALKEKLSE